MHEWMDGWIVGESSRRAAVVSLLGSMCWICLLHLAPNTSKNHSERRNDTKSTVELYISCSLPLLAPTYCSVISFSDCPCLMAASICQPCVSAG